MCQSVKRELDILYSSIRDPSAGLPEDVFLFISKVTPLINVDLLIRDERERVLLTWRDDEVYHAGWHIPGGIIRFKETAEFRIKATAYTELGATVSFGGTPLTIEQSIETERVVRGHMISLLYDCRLTSGPDPALKFSGGFPRRGQWAWHESCPENLIAAQLGYAKYFSRRSCS